MESAENKLAATSGIYNTETFALDDYIMSTI